MTNKNNVDLQKLLKDFESKEEMLKRVRARHIGISPGPSLNDHKEYVLTPEAIEELKAAEGEMRNAWDRFIASAEMVAR